MIKPKKYLKSDYDHFLTQYTSNIGFLPPSDEQRTNAKTQLDLVAKAILSSRRLAGYNPSEVLKSMEKGSIPEGVDITGETTDGASFFENELLGENSDGRAFTVLNYDNKEELQPIADKLGVSVDAIDAAQKRGLEYYQGETTPERVKKLQQEIKREDKPLRETIETQPGLKDTTDKPKTIPTVPTMEDVKVDTKVSTTEEEEEPSEPEDVKVDTKVSTTEEEEPSEPEDVKVGTRVSTTEQMTLDFDKKLDDSLINFVKEEEKFYPEAYDDYKQTSIGYGTRAKKGEKTITKEEASKRLSEELNKHAKRVKAHVKKYKYNLNQNQMNALISFDYNTGKISELTKKGTRSLSKIAEMMLLYYNAGGKKQEGLVKRRIKEQKLFLTPMSKDEKTQ